ncbi:MAG: hypothetical protein H6564_24520 [Lewinellaceae bacterium]|nr:hypothetical protein [Lewinellaceae bacterium]
MKAYTPPRWLTTVLLALQVSSFTLNAQESVRHTVYFFGNFADVEDKPAFLEQLGQLFGQTENPFTLILDGDLTKAPMEEPGDSLAEPLFRIADMAEATPNGQLLLLPGDRDWNSSRRGGEKNLHQLEKKVRDYIKKKDYRHSQWPVEDGCPGPEAIEVDESLVILVLNTQWWNHPYDKPRPSDALCDAITPANLKEELEDAVDDYQDRNILIAGHHPIYSLGNYGGYFSFAKQMAPLPVVGFFRAAFHANAGGPNDLANPRLQGFIESMNNLLFFHSNIIYAAGHEMNQQIISRGNNVLMNSGAPTASKYAARDHKTLFSAKAAGIMAIDYYDNGRVDARFLGFTKGEGLKQAGEFALFHSACDDNTPNRESIPNTSYVPCKSKPLSTGHMQGSYDEQVAIVGGAEYEAGWLKETWLGKHYRNTWTTPVRVPYLNLDTVQGGLTIYKKGGGRQTTSLKFKSGNGTEFTFRSVNKDPAKALDYHLRPSFAAGVIRDQTSTQHPYGAMAVAPLLDKIGILHATPTLYVLPDDPKLGPFQAKYGGLFGMLEENPGKPNQEGKLFGDADKVDRSTKLFRHFYKHQKTKADQNEFVRARLFDILIGDWSKHEDNWKWAAYKGAGGFTLYRPIPRDRDHAFSRQDGIIPWIADRRFGIPNIENFGYDFHDIQSLTFQARHMDRFLMSEAGREVFMEQARYIQDHITEADIEQAVRRMPSETYDISGSIVEAKLKNRLKHLSEAAEKYYRLQAREVDVLGSNESEYFVAGFREDGTLEVQMYDEDDNERGQQLLYSRVFYPGETREVRLWGLGSGDVFDIAGSGKGQIRLRAFGGPGDDVFKADTQAKARLYDKGDGTTYELSGKARAVNYWNKELYEYDRFRFAYSRLAPIVLVGYDKFAGFGTTLGANWLIRKFGKDSYHSRHILTAGLTTNDNKSISYKGRFHQAIRQWDVVAQAFIARPDFNNYYFGQGNETLKDDGLLRDGYYEARVNRKHLSAGLKRDFWQKSSFEARLGVEAAESVLADNTYLNDNTYFGAGQSLTLLPVEGNLDIDFLDNDGLPFRGARARLFYTYTSILDGADGNFGILSGDMSFFFSTRTGRPLTLGLRLGGAMSHGEAPWYKLPTLGNASGLRGYFDNRFTGESITYFNSELRYQFAAKDVAFLPFKAGVKVFFDTGRAYQDSEERNSWHSGYGFGFYFVPLDEAFTLSLSAGFSEEESFYPKFSVGTPLR